MTLKYIFDIEMDNFDMNHFIWKMSISLFIVTRIILITFHLYEYYAAN